MTYNHTQYRQISTNIVNSSQLQKEYILYDFTNMEFNTGCSKYKIQKQGKK